MAGSPIPVSAPWWADRTALLRFIADLVAGEVGALRRDHFLQADDWQPSLSLQHDLGLDSMEFLQVAGTLAATLQMQRSGVEDYLLMRRKLGDWVDIAAIALAHWGAQISFRTSGSTGQPKTCSHFTASLEQEAGALATLFARRKRVLVAVPRHHIYGFLFGTLLPRHLGLAQHAVVGIRSRLPSQLALLAAPGDLIIGHPQFWQAAMAAGARFVPDVIGVSSTAPCPAAVASGLRALGLKQLLQIYGSSETGGLGWRASHEEPYLLLPHVQRDPKDAGALLRRGPGGNLEAVQPQDELVWRDDAAFTVGSRRDGAVQVGGVNVFPERVRQVLLEHDGVADAAVRLMRPDEGQRLKAFIVPRLGIGEPALFIEQLRSWIDLRLTAPERPRAIRLGERLPRTALGKLTDWSTEA